MTSRRLILSISALLVACGLASATTACASSAKVVITEPISPKMRKYDVVNIEPSGAGARESKAARRFKEELGKRLVEKGYFSKVDPDGEVVFRARVTNLEVGDEVKRELSLKGKAEVTIEIKVQESSGKLLGHFTVVSKETRKDDQDQPVVRAISAAADEVIDYLEKKLPTPDSKAAARKPVAKDAADGDSADEGPDESADGDEKPKSDAEESAAETSDAKKSSGKKASSESED